MEQNTEPGKETIIESSIGPIALTDADANNKPKTYETLLTRVFWIVFLVLAVLFLMIFLSDRSFVNNEMQTWEDATAIVTESEVDGNVIITQEEDSNDNIYYEYKVKYYYVAEFDAWDQAFSFRYDGANTGELRHKNDEIPREAFIIPEPGDKISVIFDPASVGTYKMGSLEEWRAKAELTIGNLMFIIIFGAIAIVALCLDIYLRRRKKARELQ